LFLLKTPRSKKIIRATKNRKEVKNNNSFDIQTGYFRQWIAYGKESPIFNAKPTFHTFRASLAQTIKFQSGFIREEKIL
jgi:hypothetical protein